jgi:hypothetical protein
MPPCLAFNNSKHFAFSQNQMFFAVELDVRPAILAKQHVVAGTDIKGNSFAVFLTAGTRNDLALLGFLLGGVGNDYSTFALFFALVRRMIIRSCNGRTRVSIAIPPYI